MYVAESLFAALTAQWQGRARFVVLDDRFDGGERFQRIRAAWRGDPNRCAQLHVITVSTDLASGCTAQLLADEIDGAWPPMTPNIHRLAFDGGRVQWLLMPMPLHAALRELVAQVDAFVLTAHSAADDHAAKRQARALARLAQVGSTVWFDAAEVSANDTSAHAMRSAGFDTLCPAGRGGQDWHYAPSFTPRQNPSRTESSSPPNIPILIVGAGLAGCAMAWALAEQGRDSLVFERHRAVAMETSGNPAGLFHGIVNPQDGAHARFNRAAALEAQRAVAVALAQHGVPGSVHGLLRLEIAKDDDTCVLAMQATLARLGLPTGYAQALSAQQASAQAGIRLQHPAWSYPGGGWVQPGGLARSFIERAGGRAALRTGCSVESLMRGSGRWQLRDAGGALLAESEVVVLANAGDALRLLRPWLPISQPAVSESEIWPLLKVRGQISTIESAVIGGATLPRIPITGAGYVLPDVGGLAIFGASSQVGDDDPAVRDSDHQHNLAQLSRLTGVPHLLDVSRLGGRTGWRWTTDDRLPLLGAVPDIAAALTIDRLEQPAQVPRLPGLYACTAFGSRGITWAALAAQVVAASITGAPMPIEAGLLASVDAARCVIRTAARRSRRRC